MVVEPNVPGLQVARRRRKRVPILRSPSSQSPARCSVVYGATLAPRVAGLAGEGPCTQEKWWWSSPRKRGAPPFGPPDGPRRCHDVHGAADQHACPPAHKAPKSKEPKPKASLARVGRLFRGDREGAGAPRRRGRLLPLLRRRLATFRVAASGLSYRNGLSDHSAARRGRLRQLRHPETCQKDQSPGPRLASTRCEATDGPPRRRRPLWIRRQHGAAVRAAERRRSRARRRRPSKACGGSPRILALARRRDPRAEPLLRRRCGAGDDRNSRRRRRRLGSGYSEGRKTPPLRAGARELRGGARARRPARAGLGGLYAESWRLRGHAQVPPTDGCGPPADGNVRALASGRPAAAAETGRWACAQPRRMSRFERRPGPVLPRRRAGEGRDAQKDGGSRRRASHGRSKTGSWVPGTRTRARCARPANPRRRGAARPTRRSCSGAAAGAVAGMRRKRTSDGTERACGRSLLFRGAGTEQVRTAGGSDAHRNHIPLAQQAGYGGLLSAEGHCGSQTVESILLARADALSPGVLLRRVHDRRAALGPLRPRLVYV